VSEAVRELGTEEVMDRRDDSVARLLKEHPEQSRAGGIFLVGTGWAATATPHREWGMKAQAAVVLYVVALLGP
jgi:hypothetical protein